MDPLIKQVENYWDSHHLGTQFLSDSSVEVGTKEYFIQLDKAMERWEYKNRLIDNIAVEYQGGTLLEVGCGSGQDLVKFARRGMSVIGIDLAPSVVEMAGKHLKAYNLNGITSQGDVGHLSYPDETFDVVYSCGVLQHVPDIQRAISEIHRVTRRAGLVVVVVYHRYSWFNFLSKIARINIEFEDKDPPIINTYSKRDLYCIFSNFFKNIKIESEYCYPVTTPRKGFLPYGYNNIFIPILKRIPYAFIKNLGWHLVLTCVK